MKTLRDIARTAAVAMAAIAGIASTASCGKDVHLGEASAEDGSRYYIRYEAVSDAQGEGAVSSISAATAVGEADFEATSEFATVTGPVSRDFETAITATVLEGAGVTTRIYVSKDGGDFALVASSDGEGFSSCNYRIDF